MVLHYCPKEDNQVFYNQCLSFFNLLEGLDESDINIQLLSTLLMGQRLFETPMESMDNKLKEIFELVLNIGDVIDKK